MGGGGMGGCGARVSSWELCVCVRYVVTFLGTYRA